MLAVLSPSKTLDESAVKAIGAPTEPSFLKDAATLVNCLKTLSEEDLQQLMSISPKLAELNARRYQGFQMPFTADNSKQALLMFKGDVYDGLDAASLTAAERARSNDSLRILSGLYGLLRPLDLMQPYRLEMGTKLKNERGKNLYDFWGTRLSRALNEALSQQDKGEKRLINLASNEYFKAVDIAALDCPVTTIHFKEEKGDMLKVIGLHAKKARGLMARFIVQQQPKTPEDLEAFNAAGYRFRPSLSSAAEMVFSRV